MTSEDESVTDSQLRCGIVLAGGEGVRLREFIGQLRGKSLPKQYVNFIGTRSMLEHTFQRAERLIPAERLWVSITRHHLEYSEARLQLSKRPKGTVVVQPANKETAPGILLPLLYVYKRYPESAVVLFPSDHFILHEDIFAAYVDRAFHAVAQDSSRIVLLGAEPDEPIPDYGYLIPGVEIDQPSRDSIRTVELFIEKPAVAMAEKLIKTGALWNTAVLVAVGETLIEAFQQTLPELYDLLCPISELLGTPDERRALEEIYEKLKPINFSQSVLQELPYEHRRNLVVLLVRGVGWSDWGTSERISSLPK